jgi:hypothetical protein
MSKGRKCCMGLYESIDDTHWERKCNRCGHIKRFGGRRNKQLTNCYKTRIN